MLDSCFCLAVLIITGLSLWAPALRAVPSIPDTAAVQPEKPVALEIESGGRGSAAAECALIGPDARRQILVTARLPSGALEDFTRQAKYEIAPADIARVDPLGVVTPLHDGRSTITARAGGISAKAMVTVAQYEQARLINFPNQIVPIFTKAGCNAGGCHGKASGQNGFRLSLLGFEPAEDYEHLVKEARGRRLFPAAPDRSLLLLKATATLAHGGGQRLELNSDDYRLIVRWITQGMPYGKPEDPTIECLEVWPRQRTMQFHEEQQLLALAHYSDGSVQDVTPSALYEPNDKNLAAVNASGLVQVYQQPGDVGIMVRYQGKVAVFEATIPLGAPVGPLPVARNFIDELVFAKLKRVGLPPSTNCDDATFLRRVTIDIAGRLPTLAETQRFLAEATPDKRDRWIDGLLASSDYADYFADSWSAILRNRRATPNDARGTVAFHDWIRDSLKADKPYDQIVREIVTAAGELEANPPVAWYRQVNNLNVQVEDTAQLFLGLRLQCARCHHHPFDKWSQKDYYSFAAFFSQVTRKRGPQPGEEYLYVKRTMASATNTKDGRSVKPAGLGGAPLNLSPDEDARQALVDWMTAKPNAFFARALVNRYWKHFFGRGLVEPEDDLRETNPPTNRELLDALADHFVRSGYHLKDLVRTICRSAVYQRSSVPNQFNEADKQYFSHYYPKRLTAEVLLDAVDQVTHTECHFEGLPPGTRAVQLPDNSYNATSYFLTVFGRPDASSSCECERSQGVTLAQSLHLLNAKEILEKLDDKQSRPVLLAGDTSHDDAGKVRELYLCAYSRPPNAQELAIAEQYTERKQPGKPEAKQAAMNQRQAFEDLCWALINTKEFLFNH